MPGIIQWSNKIASQVDLSCKITCKQTAIQKSVYYWSSLTAAVQAIQLQTMVRHLQVHNPVGHLSYTIE